MLGGSLMELPQRRGFFPIGRAFALPPRGPGFPLRDGAPEPPGLSLKLPADLVPGLPEGFPPGLPDDLPVGRPVDPSAGLPVGLPFGFPKVMPPDFGAVLEPGLPLGFCPGFAPGRPRVGRAAGVSSISSASSPN